jgi:HAD superfamily hydrolase (TIGR01509 family)
VIRAIIFDLDGTLADTEPLHYEAFAQALRPEGIELSRDYYFRRLIGYNDRDCFAILLLDKGTPGTEARIAELVERKAAAYMKMLANRDLLYPGAADFVRKCAERFPLIIVTGTLRHEAELILTRAHIRNSFIDIIAAEDVEHGKPEADPFLAALGRLGFLLRPHPTFSASECLVVEDTAVGIEAAHHAGMKVLALCNTAPAETLKNAEIVRRSFPETDLDDVLRRLSQKPHRGGRA